MARNLLENAEFRQNLTIILLIFFIGMDAYILYVAFQYYPYEEYWTRECAKRVEIVDSWCAVHMWDIDPGLNRSWKNRLVEWTNASSANMSNSSWVMG